jgi:hypothetical protein
MVNTLAEFSAFGVSFAVGDGAVRRDETARQALDALGLGLRGVRDEVVLAETYSSKTVKFDLLMMPREGPHVIARHKSS